MSTYVTPHVWKTKLGNAPAKSVLAMLAEVVNDDGFGWPSMSTVCDRTELSLRQVQRVLQVFGEIGLVQKTTSTLRSGKVVPAYQIKLEMLGQDLRAVFRAAFLRAQGKLRPGSVSETLSLPVSETSENVSETQTGVSETHPPDPLYGGTVRELSGTTPPTPASGGGEVFSLHPLLLSDAADEVMRCCGFTDRRVRHAVNAQLKLASMLGEALPLIAARMIQAWTDQAQANEEGLLRVIYGAKKFIGDGKWNDSGTWHWDHQAIERKRNARVGMG